MPYRTLLGIALTLSICAISALPADAVPAGSSASEVLQPARNTTRNTQRTATPTPTPTPTPAPSATGTFVKIYKNIVNNVQSALTPEDVQVTSDGGSILLGLTYAPQNGAGVSWLVKTDAAGTPQWQEELGCFGSPPGDYANGVSILQTTDGGYVVGGGTTGCGSASICPSTSSIQCALVEKVDSLGKVAWAKVYFAGAAGSAITQIKQTSDGGLIAVGSATDLSQNIGALIIKLDAQGNVQWQRQLGPSPPTMAYFNAVQQTSDGGFAVTGEFFVPASGPAPTSVLAVKFDSIGNLQWQSGFNTLSSTGAILGREHSLSIVQALDGGYVIGGNWTTSTYPGDCCTGALLLKLGSTGTMQWQLAYAGGVNCANQTCTNFTGIIYSVHQTGDGGYVVAGAFDEQQGYSVLVPWLAKVDAAGSVLWQHLYYETNPSTGAPLSAFFASSALDPGGRVLGLGWTEDPTTLLGDFFSVKTDSFGLVGTCTDVKNPMPISAINPGLSSLAPALPLQTTSTPSGQGSSTTLSTSINTLARC